MLGRLMLLFIVVPIIELAILIGIAGVIDVWPTVALVIVTGAIGAFLTRYQGLRTLARFQESLASGRSPHVELIDGLLILVAGAVLITPGVITDVAGFLLLVPAVRGIIRERLRRRFVAVPGGGGVTFGGGAPFSPSGGDADGPIIDAEFTVNEDQPH